MTVGSESIAAYRGSDHAGSIRAMPGCPAGISASDQCRTGITYEYTQATMLFQKAMESGEFAGNPLHLEFHEDDIEKLPGCRNDHEFGFGRGICSGQDGQPVVYRDKLMVRYHL